MSKVEIPPNEFFLATEDFRIGIDHTYDQRPYLKVHRGELLIWQPDHDLTRDYDFTRVRALSQVEEWEDLYTATTPAEKWEKEYPLVRLGAEPVAYTMYKGRVEAAPVFVEFSAAGRTKVTRF